MLRHASTPVPSIGSTKALYKKRRLIAVKSHFPRTRSSARYLFAVKMSAPGHATLSKALHKRRYGRTVVSPRKYFCRGPSPRISFCSAIYRDALKAPGSTVMQPNTDSLRRRCEMWRKGARQDIQKLVKDIGHLVLEVLCSHCIVRHEVKNKGYFKAIQETNQEG
jgi:hypothetical protein